MKHLNICAAGLVVLGLAGPAGAADYSDPTWPCVQRKVEALSIGLMWPYEIPEIKMTPEQAEAVDNLAARLVLRRVELEQAEAFVSDFTDQYGAGEGLLGHVFERVFTLLANRRSVIIDGIEDFSLKQIAMSERIDAARGEMDALMAADEPDFDQVDKIEEQIDWDERIYTDRQRSLTYICETPVLLEKRLYAIAQMLMEKARG